MMRFSALLVATIGWLVLAGAASAAPQVRIRQAGDDVFIAGPKVSWQEKSAGAVLAAGGEVMLAGNVGADAVAAGGNVTVRSNVAGDLYAAGGQLRIAGTVAGDARLAGGEITIDPGARIGSGATLAGGRVLLGGRVGSYAQIAAGRTEVNGTVGGDLNVSSGALVIGPNAHIDGRLTYRGPQPPQIADGARIAGGVNHITTETGARWLAPFAIIGAILWFIGWIIAGALLIGLAPVAVRRVTDAMRGRAWQSLLFGFLLFVLVPIVAGVLLFTVIGTPLGLLLAVAYLLLLPLGYLAGAAAIGDWTIDRMRRTASPGTAQRILAFALALLLLTLLIAVPIVGWLLAWLVVLLGIGAIVLALRGERRPA